MSFEDGRLEATRSGGCGLSRAILRDYSIPGSRSSLDVTRSPGIRVYLEWEGLPTTTVFNVWWVPCQITFLDPELSSAN